MALTARQIGGRGGRNYATRFFRWVKYYNCIWYKKRILDVLSRPFCPRRSVPLPFCPGQMPFCPTFLSRHPVPLSFCPEKSRFVPLIKRGRERPPGKPAEEVELETDDEGNNPTCLSNRNPLSNSNPKEVVCYILFVVNIIYNFHLLSVGLLRLREYGSPTFASWVRNHLLFARLSVALS